MNRREVLAGAAAVAALPVTAQAKTDIEQFQELVMEAADGAPIIDFVEMEDKYWEAQWLINEYEEERQEMRAHAKIMKKARVV